MAVLIEGLLVLNFRFFFLRNFFVFPYFPFFFSSKYWNAEPCKYIALMVIIKQLAIIVGYVDICSIVVGKARAVICAVLCLLYPTGAFVAIHSQSLCFLLLIKRKSGTWLASPRT